MKDQKYAFQQIEYVDNLVQLIGFKNLSDTETSLFVGSSLSIGSIPTPTINNINNTMPQFKKYFPTKSFSLSRLNFVLQTTAQTVAFLKNCLTHIGMNYETYREKNRVYLRLKPLNNLLYTYIQKYTKMSDIVHPQESNIDPILTPSGVEIVKNVTNHHLVRKTVQMTGSRRNKLELPIETPVRRLKLINLPANYQYKLFCNGHEICTSQLVGEHQTFDFSLDKRADNSVLSIWIDIAMGELLNNLPKEVSRNYLDFGRIDCAWIDVVNSDPYDSFHIYNPSTKRFLFDEYTFEVDGLRSEGEVNSQPVEFIHQFTVYPNRTYLLHCNHPTTQIQLAQPHSYVLKLGNQIIAKSGESGHVGLDTASLIQQHGNLVEKEMSVEGYKTNCQGQMNAKISELFGEDKADEISQETVNMSRIDHQRLVLDHETDQVTITLTQIYYNIMTHNEDGQPSYLFV